MATTIARSEHASVNDLSMYFEIHGTGRPLMLLHGGLDTIETCFGRLLPALAESRQVVAVELQGHGHTADVDRPMRYEQLADDVAALVEHLGLGPVDLFGFSLGGGVALQAAIRHPRVVRKVAVASAPFRSDGWYTEIRDGIASLTADELVGSPWQEAYSRVAPDPENWPTLIAKVGDLVGRQSHDWSTAVTAITAPVLIVVGDADSVRLSHAFEMYGLLGGGKADGGLAGLPNARLAVLPATTHLDVTSHDLLPSILDAFFDPPSANET